MPLSLCDLDRFVPLVQLLVHLHRVFNPVVIEQDLLGPCKLFIKDGQPRLNLVKVNSVLPPCLLLVIINQFIDLPEVGCPSHVAQRGVAMLRDRKVLLLQSNLSQNLPIRFGILRHLKRVEDRRCLIKVPLLNGEPELDQRLVELVGHRRVALVNDNLRFARRPFDLLDVPLNSVERHLIRVVN